MTTKNLSHIPTNEILWSPTGDPIKDLESYVKEIEEQCGREFLPLTIEKTKWLELFSQLYYDIEKALKKFDENFPDIGQGTPSLGSMIYGLAMMTAKKALLWRLKIQS